MSLTTTVAHRSAALAASVFDAFLRQGDVPFLISFWAPWCYSCRGPVPTPDQLAVELGGRLRAGRIKVDEAANPSVRCGVHSVPARLLVGSGNAVASPVGAQPREAMHR